MEVQKMLQKGEKKKRRENWAQGDDLALSKLIHQYDFAWDHIKQDFFKLNGEGVNLLNLNKTIRYNMYGIPKLLLVL
jgi:hypothetical protein